MWHTVYICPNFTCQTSFNPWRPTTAPAAEPVGCFNGQGCKKNGNPQKRSHSIGLREPQHYPQAFPIPQMKGTPNHKLFASVCWVGYVGVCSRGMTSNPPFPKSYDHLKERLPKWDNYTVQAGADFELFGCLLEYHPPQLQRHLADIPVESWLLPFEIVQTRYHEWVQECVCVCTKLLCCFNDLWG